MASYPNSIFSPRAKENRSGVVYDSTKKTVGFVEDVSKLDDEVVALETRAVGRVATVENIDFKVLGDTLLYTVPAGYEFFLFGFIERAKTYEEVVNDGFLILKRGSDNIPLTDVIPASEIYSIPFYHDLFYIYGNYPKVSISGGDSVKLEITVAETGTAFTFDVDLIGYLLPV